MYCADMFLRSSGYLKILWIIYVFEVYCYINFFTDIMASPGQKKGNCRNMMVSFDLHKKCAHRCNKGVGDDPCIVKLECEYCNSLTAEQKLQ